MNISRTRRLGIILFFGGFVIGIPGVMLMLLPDRYEATARLVVIVDKQNNRVTPEAVKLIEVEVETVKSDLVLSKVIETLHLEDEWAKRYNHGNNLQTGEALLLLKQSVHLKQVKGVLFDVRVTSEIPEEAAEIANTVASTYIDHKWDQSEKGYGKGIEELAQPPTAPTGENRPGKILLGAGIFLILAGLRCLWRAYFAAPRA